VTVSIYMTMRTYMSRLKFNQPPVLFFALTEKRPERTYFSREIGDCPPSISVRNRCERRRRCHPRDRGRRLTGGPAGCRSKIAARGRTEPRAADSDLPRVRHRIGIPLADAACATRAAGKFFISR
jgi:hypothetical protein